jgi:hypothetical protein
VPVAAVEALVRAGLTRGLSTDGVGSFLRPTLLRGISDPYGGGGVISFIVERGDRALFDRLAAFAAEPGPAPAPQMEAQRALLASFPELVIVYQSLARAEPIDPAGAMAMVDLANSGYRPAQRTIDRVLAAGSVPQAGAQWSGAVADGVRPEVYDIFVSDYRGPLSPAGRAAAANRASYQEWADRIASWVASGASMDAIPAGPTFIDTAAAFPTASVGSADIGCHSG